MLPAYCDLLYRTPPYVSEMTRYSKGIWSSRLRLYPEAFLSLRTVVPPVEEQEAIGAAYQEAREPIDELRRTLDQSQQQLAARRQSLITAAITGALPPETRQPELAGVAA
jgi:type I restriction enzyme S subunit